ncbi:terminase [Clostridium carboxidivorans P7]|uniref:phage terminase small subunit n=1 Tax=Clostridium carboxidivorans TaxID=217159 RepID=UPI00064E4E6E|nr:phage terminase small subunit [Clostridium carboxidivorans]AKN32392.1 terminase [Clostridium carboxidivorans P7]
MANIRAPDIKEQAKKDYIKGMKYKDLAEKYNVSLNTIKSWKTRYKWNRKGVHTKEEKNKKSVHTKRGAPKGNKNSVGHESSVPKGNKNAETHGFFSKIFPPETIDIVEEIMVKDPLDMLWENIIIQYTAIARSQRIMNVTEKEEMIKELKRSKVKSKDRSTQKTSTNESEQEYEYEFQFAWDRQATFLQAQSRAMSELRSLIKQYDEMLHTNWNLATEEQKLRINKLKVDIEKTTGDGNKDNDLAKAVLQAMDKRKNGGSNE